MKTIYFIPLIFLTACSTTPKLVLRPQQPPPATDNSAVRYPEVVRAYHFGRYVDPNDDLVMHEQHVVYRVEENTRWNLHPGPAGGSPVSPAPSRNAAFNPTPVNDAILAEVNSQRLATTQIIAGSQILAATLQQLEGALRSARRNEQVVVHLQIEVDDLKKRLAALEAVPAPPTAPSISTTNEPPTALGP
ncbi:MAG TPA: hypothetical protein VMV89_00055 [Candidatus Paceibacterota bacterium]|nr:hypothetical protein [Candidatus Paceibacterota bacterium]